MKRTAVFILVAALLMQVAGCVTYTVSKAQPIPGVGKKYLRNALRLSLSDLEVAVRAVQRPEPFRWPTGKASDLVILVVLDPRTEGVEFDPFRVAYSLPRRN